jgi:hypothetical protein
MAKRYYDNRMKATQEGGEMISSEPRGYANLPQNVVMKMYPEQSYAAYDGTLNDNLRGIDMGAKANSKVQRGYPGPEKI